jgi:hypothetical protein
MNQLAKLRARGLDDWPPNVRSARKFALFGGACAVAAAKLVPPFDGDTFYYVYWALGLAALWQGLTAMIRVASLMKFEIGPRFLNIPRVSRTLVFASLLATPCVILQNAFPIPTLVAFRTMAHEDVRPIKDLVKFYKEAGKGLIGSVPAPDAEKPFSSDKDSEAATIAQVQRLQVDDLIKRADAVYAKSETLVARYPELGTLAGERSLMKKTLERRNDQLHGLVEPKASGPLAKSETDCLHVSTDEGRMQYDGLKGCEVLSKLKQLSRLRARSLGSDLHIADADLWGGEHQPSGETPLYVSMFGFASTLKVLALCATLAVLLRIERLSDSRVASVCLAMGITYVVVFLAENPDPVSELKDSYWWPVAFWLGVLFLVAYLHRRRQGRRGGPVRFLLLAAPAMILVSPVHAGLPLVQLLLPVSIVGLMLLAVLIWHLDRLMVEENCIPQSE